MNNCNPGKWTNLCRNIAKDNCSSILFHDVLVENEIYFVRKAIPFVINDFLALMKYNFSQTKSIFSQTKKVLLGLNFIYQFLNKFCLA